MKRPGEFVRPSISATCSGWLHQDVAAPPATSESCSRQPDPASSQISPDSFEGTFGPEGHGADRRTGRLHLHNLAQMGRC